MKTRLFLFLLALGCIMGSACTESRCAADEDCLTGYKCTQGQCIGSVRPSTKLCAVGDNCEEPKTLTPICKPSSTTCQGNTRRSCHADGSGWQDLDCGAFHTCRGGRCVRNQPPTGCGNGTIEGNEQCDDGNQRSGDGCSRYCQSEKINRFEPPVETHKSATFVLGSARCRNPQYRKAAMANPHRLYIYISPTVCRIDGKPVVEQATIEAGVAHLNKVFKATRITFLLKPTAWEDDADQCEVFYKTESIDALNRHAKESSISVFYVTSITGGNFSIAGYASLPGVVMKAPAENNNVTLNSLNHTLAHEIGHTFGLDHPHACRNGEENKENCSTHGDQLCDTPYDPGPDGIKGIASCDGVSKDGQCTIKREGGTCKVTCPNGEKPLFTNLMSYYKCGDDLTPAQVATVRCLALNEQVGRVRLYNIPCETDNDCGGDKCGDDKHCPNPKNACLVNSTCNSRSAGTCRDGHCGSCIWNGNPAKIPEECCDKKRDERGLCCHDFDCCSARNKAVPKPDGSCGCMPGYRRQDPNSTRNVRCLKIPTVNNTTCQLNRTLTGHNSTVTALAFNATGSYLASASYDKTIRIWEIARNKLVATLKGHESGVTSLVFSRKSGLLASGDLRKNLLHWNIRAGKQVKSESLPHAIRGVDVRRDSKQFALGLTRGFALRTFGKPQVLLEETMFIRQLRFHPKGHHIAITTNKKTAMIYDTATHERVHLLEGHKRGILSIGYNKDGSMLATGSDEVWIWDAATGKKLRAIKAHKSYTYSLAWHPKLDILFTGGMSDHTVKLWDAKTGNLLQTLEGHTRGIPALAVHPLGTFIASGSSDKSIKLWSCR